MDRRLAAILHADVVGYSRLMEGAETQTFRELKTLFDHVWLPALGRHTGRLVNTAGDAMLVEFSSAVAAVRCAMELQVAMAQRNADRPPQRHVLLRIGLNIGEVIVDGDNIFGDEVNVAARIQALAEPGTVVVSARVREAVEGKIGFGFFDLGDQQVKNISRPVRVHRVLAVDQGAEAPTSLPPQRPATMETPSQAAAQPSLGLPHAPTVSAPLASISYAPSPAPLVGWRLVGADRAGTRVDMRLDGGLLQQHEGVVFGRMQRYCQLTIDNDSISRRHARFRAGPGGVLTVEDLGSTNGTAVDGQRIAPYQPIPLRDGARISLGEIKVVVSRG
ncbi:adenylate/guanylate cyclase domain-containing protein [Vineibacter terrae]|uniref:adenylate/guanylate cyclase domain-containing protein n=1 Tax=Vineibacter terrae TaxID=2586908 RepID=UPI002E303E59|nr:adenylate/guanylate cyclase domain-containing protein [Vineibacter terrae]HEX2885271.1 adenylate/guanylate cyclase domain-containing protein [Vineibacter terrae]